MEDTIDKFERVIEVDLLMANYYTKQKSSYEYIFSDDEIIGLKEELYKISLKMSNRQALQNYVKDLMQNSTPEATILEYFHEIELEEIGDIGIKELKRQYSSLVALIKNGFEIRYQDVYGMANYETGFIVFYTEDGFYVDHRLLTEHELQTKIK